MSKKYPTLSPPAKNNASPAKWFWQIVTSQLLHTHKKFQTDSWHGSFFEAFSDDGQFFACKRNDKKHRIKILYQVLPKAR